MVRLNTQNFTAIFFGENYAQLSRYCGLRTRHSRRTQSSRSIDHYRHFPGSNWQRQV